MEQLLALIGSRFPGIPVEYIPEREWNWIFIEEFSEEVFKRQAPDLRKFLAHLPKALQAIEDTLEAHADGRIAGRRIRSRAQRRAAEGDSGLTINPFGPMYWP